MTSIPLLIWTFKFCLIGVANCLYLDGASLLDLLNVADATLTGLGFQSEKCKREVSPFPAYFPSENSSEMQNLKIGRFRNDAENHPPDFSAYSEFQKIYLGCQMMHQESSTCLATCIFGKIIQRENYGHSFLTDLQSNKYLHYDTTEIFPHLISYDLHTDPNIFCAKKEYWAELFNQLSSCRETFPSEICILGEDKLLCDPRLGNCNFDEKTLSVIPIGHIAHPLTCGDPHSLNWTYFEKASKYQCLLPRRKQLLHGNRPIFKHCDICKSKQSKKNKEVIEFLTTPTKEEFAKAAQTSIPIVIRNGAPNLDLNGVDRINISLIKQLYKDVDPAECDFNALFSKYASLHDVWSSVSDDLVWNAENSWYIRWQLCNPEIRKKLQHYILRPNYLPEDYPAFDDPWMFAGSPDDGVFNPHLDYISAPSWQLQLSGNKRWFLRIPPECRKLCSSWLQVTVNQGDLFFFEAKLWAHGTHVEKGKMSIAMSTGIEHKRKNI